MTRNWTIYEINREYGKNGHRYYAAYLMNNKGQRQGDKIATAQKLFACVDKTYRHACESLPVNTRINIDLGIDVTERIAKSPLILLRFLQDDEGTYRSFDLYTTYDKQLYHA